MDKSRVEHTIFFIEKISFSLKLLSSHFYGQSFIKTVQGPLTTPPHISRIIQYKTLRSELFVIYIYPYYLCEVIQYYNAIKKERKCIIGAHQGIDPGPEVL